MSLAVGSLCSTTPEAEISPRPHVESPGGTTSPATGSSVAQEDQAIQEAPRPKTRLQSSIRKPKLYNDGTVRYGYFTSTGEPQNLGEAIGNKNWKHAMDLEYLALMENNTCHLVPPQQRKNVIDCK
jgi:hypothetical protein